MWIGAISNLLALDHPVHLLVVDNSSPDQTANAVNAADAPHPKGQVTVLCRPQPAGLASAYRASFSSGLKQGYEAIKQTDADRSHPPSDTLILQRVNTSGFELPISGRYITGRSTDPDWASNRKAPSLARNTYTRTILPVPYRNLKGSLKAWRTELFGNITPMSGAPSRNTFQMHTTYCAHLTGAHIIQIPFASTDCCYGT